MNPHPPTQPTARLTYLAGQRIGNQELLGTEPFTFQDIFTIQTSGSHHILKTINDKVVMVANRPVRERILQYGDVIHFGTDEMEYNQIAGTIDLAIATITQPKTIFRTLSIATAIGLALLFLLRITQHTPQPPTYTPTTIEKNTITFTDSQKIALARLDYDLALRLLQEAQLRDGNRYQAIQAMRRALHTVSTIQPPPAIVETLNNKITENENILLAELEALKANALLVWVAGRKGDYQQILLSMLATMPDQNNSDHIWARNKLINLNLAPTEY